jgi:hypothetical protein
LLVGTTSANGRLTVAQNAGRATFDSLGGYFTVELSSNGNRRAFYGYNEGTGQWQLNNVTAGGTEQSVLLYDRTSAYLSFGTNGSERARISSTGQRSTNIVSTVGTSYSTLYPAYDCRAWVNFAGVGTVAIRASGNVSSITDNGVGDYTANFTTSMPDADYSAVFSASGTISGTTNAIAAAAVVWTVNTVRLRTTMAGTFYDSDVCGAVFR